ncbi:glycosyltransferase family 39 protein [Achromobacter xylosoxidans]
MIAFAAPWLWLLERSTLAPPTDNIEQLTWVRSLEWGYYKHPPLPTWLLWPFVQALGWSAWTTYVLGALCTLGGFFIYWRMLRGMRGGAYALVALLAGLCVTFYNYRLHFYNHEIPLITFVAGAALPAGAPGRRARSSGGWRWACAWAWARCPSTRRPWPRCACSCSGSASAAGAIRCRCSACRWRRSPRWRSSSRTCTGSSSTTSNRWAMRCRPAGRGPVLGRAFARSGALVGRPDPEPRIAGLGLAGRPVAGHAPVASGGSPGGGMSRPMRRAPCCSRSGWCRCCSSA